MTCTASGLMVVADSRGGAGLLRVSLSDHAVPAGHCGKLHTSIANCSPVGVSTV